MDHPNDDGIYLVDLHTGAAELTASLDHIASVRPHPSMHGAINWVNHLIFSPDDSQAMFVHRWWPPGVPRFRTRFMLLRIDDGSVREIWPTRASHMCWRSPSQILFSAIPADMLDNPESSAGRYGLLAAGHEVGRRARRRSHRPPARRPLQLPTRRPLRAHGHPAGSRRPAPAPRLRRRHRTRPGARPLPLPAALRWPRPLRPASALEPRRPAGLHRLRPRRNAARCT